MKKNFQKIIFLGMISFILITFQNVESVNAATYYVDAVDGNDTYNGLAPEFQGGETGPWKTVSQVSNSTFSGGDTILFKSGQEWYGQITLNINSNFDSEVAISNYGVGERPIINGAETITSSWTRFDGWFEGDLIDYLVDPPVYYVSNINKASQLFVDGERMMLARHPNPKGSPYQTSNDGDGYINIGPNPTSTSLKTEEPLNFLNTYALKDTQIYIRLNAWHIDKREVTGYNSTSAIVNWTPETTFPSVDQYKVKEGYGFFLSDNLPLLDLAGEWWYDEERQKLYVWISDNSHPQNHTISVSKYNYGIFSNNADLKLRIENLIIKNFAATGILVNTKNATIVNTDVLYSNEYGIYSNNADHVGIENCTISSSNANGIEVTYCKNIILLDNVISNNGRISTQPVEGGPGQKLSNIWIGGFETAELRGNSVSHSGWSGVSVGTAESMTSLVVSENNISEYCLSLDDCGGIYIHGGEEDIILEESLISNNVISWGRSNTDGIPNSELHPASTGIYLDWCANNVTIEENSVIGAWSNLGAIFIHGGNNNTIRYNTVRQWGYPTMGVSEYDCNDDGVINDLMRNNRVYQNIFYMESGSNVNLHRFWKQPYSSDGGVFGFFYNNYYYNPYAPVVNNDPQTWGIIKEFYRYDGINWTSWYNEWAENTIQEAPLWYYIYQPWTGEVNIKRFVNGTDETQNYSLDTKYCDVDGNTIEGTLSLEPFSSELLIRCYCNFDDYCYYKETHETCQQDCAPPPPPSTTMIANVQYLDKHRCGGGGLRRKYRPEAKIRITDENWIPIPDAEVYGHWEWQIYHDEESYCVTDSSGRATCYSERCERNLWYGCFEVDNVTKDGYDFDPNQGDIRDCRNF
ncbi:MAG: right-handed parallel beta-helix repeat-containing protein [Candidatus Omnitrophica bacterium]|nr:right-handed parallel beta-helix repeat-containing protein [Candidatus Omnitrophota bacterium]